MPVSWSVPASNKGGPTAGILLSLIFTLILLSPQPVLYSYFRSSCSWRVRIGKSSASGGGGGGGVGQRTSYPHPVPSRPPATSIPVLEPPSLNVTSSQKVRQEDRGSGMKWGCFSPWGCHTALEKPLATMPRPGSQNPEVPGNQQGSSWPPSGLIFLDLANQTAVWSSPRRFQERGNSSPLA